MIKVHYATVFFLLLTFLGCTFGQTKLRLVYEWQELEFAFPDEGTKQRAIETEDYIRGNSVPIDVDVHYRKGGNNRVFVTVPRFDRGIPYTLGIVSNDAGDGGPTVVPYPDPSWHENPGASCEGITSVFRIAIDECGRLWVLDTGKIGDNTLCPPQLLVFDLNTDKLIHRHRIQQSSLRNHSILITPILDIRDPLNGCRDTFVYIADVNAFGLVVYDHSRDMTWRVENKLFYPYPSWGTYNIDGESFDLMDGLFGLALSPLKSRWDDRTLYFHALASVSENFVPTSVIRNETAWTTSSANPREFQSYQGTRVSQAAAQAMDKDGIMYFGLATPMAIACWDSSTPYASKNIDIVAQDSQTLQFASGLKVITNLKGSQEVWILTCSFQRIMTGNIRNTEVNYRILAGNTKDLLWGSSCKSGRPNGVAPPGVSNLVGSYRPTGYVPVTFGPVKFP